MIHLVIQNLYNDQDSGLEEKVRKLKQTEASLYSKLAELVIEEEQTEKIDNSIELTIISTLQKLGHNLHQFSSGSSFGLQNVDDSEGIK